MFNKNTTKKENNTWLKQTMNEYIKDLDKKRKRQQTLDNAKDIAEKALLLGVLGVCVVADAEIQSRVDRDKYATGRKYIDQIALMDDFGGHTYYVERDLDNLCRTCNSETKNMIKRYVDVKKELKNSRKTYLKMYVIK